jgi:hypothetical protein
MHYLFLVPLDLLSSRRTSFYVPLFLIYEKSLFALGCYAYTHLWLDPIHHSDIYSHFGLSSNCFFLINAFSCWTIFPHMSFLLTIETFHIIVRTKSLVFVIILIVIIVSTPSTILPSLVSIVLPTIPSWWLVIWLIVKPSLVIRSRIILLPSLHHLFCINLYNIYKHILVWTKLLFFGALIHVMIIILIKLALISVMSFIVVILIVNASLIHINLLFTLVEINQNVTILFTTTCDL